MQYEILKIQKHPEHKLEAAQWFHKKWGIPLEAYIDSMDECLKCAGAVYERYGWEFYVWYKGTANPI